MLFSAAAVDIVSTPVYSDFACSYFSSALQSNNRLPERAGKYEFVVNNIPGSVAMKLFPTPGKKISAQKTYRFAADLKECKNSRASKQVQVNSAPFKVQARTKRAYELSLDLGLEPTLANLLRYLPADSAKSRLIRGKDKFNTSATTAAGAGVFWKECVFAVGWECIGKFQLYEPQDGDVATMNFLRPTFFPASLDGKPLLESKWVTGTKA
ncbi:hypothetical protein DFQ27_002498 [Actinomortierella ambigua]|uniref:Uncharacterized protein n=1 Tax=Actinomortierella ambigua TaxID=1343610 RepID=A0A9P6QBD8_9FUNG|nr:hypothetical protein DFQ27_002498 [Actinomortierella ambigua]